MAYLAIAEEDIWEAPGLAVKTRLNLFMNVTFKAKNCSLDEAIPRLLILGWNKQEAQLTLGRAVPC